MAWVGRLLCCLANVCILWHGLVGYWLAGCLANLWTLQDVLVGWCVVWLIFVHCGMGWMVGVLFG